MNISILSWIVFLPLFGMILILIMPGGRHGLIRAAATAATGAVLALTIKLLL
ncbi:MAG: hypothetical protein HY585_01800, partial [Candidatus Omnitrophica bacterium]|nr:hypothetical protein [Candidatus Omnitrophota bacterium]